MAVENDGVATRPHIDETALAAALAAGEISPWRRSHSHIILVLC